MWERLFPKEDFINHHQQEKIQPVSSANEQLFEIREEEYEEDGISGIDNQGPKETTFISDDILGIEISDDDDEKADDF